MAITLGVLPWVFFFVFTQQTVDALFRLWTPAANVTTALGL